MTLAQLTAATRFIAEEHLGVHLRAVQRREQQDQQATADALRARGLVTPAPEPVT